MKYTTCVYVKDPILADIFFMELIAFKSHCCMSFIATLRTIDNDKVSRAQIYYILIECLVPYRYIVCFNAAF